MLSVAATSAATRRRLLQTALAAAALVATAAPVRSATAAPAGMDRLGVFSLLGDGLQLTKAGPITDTRLDRNVRESLPTKDVGFDQAALRAINKSLPALAPRTALHMFRATQPMTLEEQRAVSDGATRAQLPAWIADTINRQRLTHVLLLTRHRGDAQFPVTDGFTVGRGTVDGIGYYLDSDTDIKNRATGLPSQGFLGAYVMLRLQLLEVASGNVIGSETVRAGQLYAGMRDAEAANVWNALEPVEKVTVLRDMVQSNVERVLPALLRGGDAR
jgi:hypothetical protein